MSEQGQEVGKVDADEAAGKALDAVRATAAQQRAQDGGPAPAPRKLEGLDAEIHAQASVAAAHAQAIVQAVRTEAGDEVVSVHLGHLTNAVQAVTDLHVGSDEHEDFPTLTAATPFEGDRADEVHYSATALHQAVHSGADVAEIVTHANDVIASAQVLKDHVTGGMPLVASRAPVNAAAPVGNQSNSWLWIAGCIVTLLAASAVAWDLFGDKIRWTH